MNKKLTTKLRKIMTNEALSPVVHENDEEIILPRHSTRENKVISPRRFNEMFVNINEL